MPLRRLLQQPGHLGFERRLIGEHRAGALHPERVHRDGSVRAEDRAFCDPSSSRGLLARPPECESGPPYAAHRCCERRPRHDEAYESVPKPSAPAEPTEEKTDRFPKAPALGPPGWVRPLRVHPSRRCSYARRERIERFDDVVKRVSKRFAKLGRRRCVDRLLRTPAQLRLRFGGLRCCSRGPERLLE